MTIILHEKRVPTRRRNVEFTKFISVATFMRYGLYAIGIIIFKILCI